MSNSTIFVTLPSQRHSTILAELFINQTDKITLFSILRPEALFGNNALQLKSLDYYKGAAMAFLAAMCLAWQLVGCCNKNCGKANTHVATYFMPFLSP